MTEQEYCDVSDRVILTNIVSVFKELNHFKSRGAIMKLLIEELIILDKKVNDALDEVD